MMIAKFVLICALVVAPALAKGVAIREEPKELEKTSQREELSKTSQRVEQLKVEQVEVEQQREEFSQIKDEELPVQQLREEAPIKGQAPRYEAKPIREELAKGQPELPKAVKGFEPQRAIEEQKYEQQQEQVEIKQEEYVEQAPLAPAQAIKGAPLVAPLGQAEPYSFSYQAEGSSRKEESDANGVVRGQYTLQGGDGAQRVVEYVADQNGFRASVNTNEFGTENRSPAAVNLRSSQPSAESITKGLEPAVAAAPALAPTKTREEAPRISQVLYAETKGAAPIAPLAIPAAPLEKARPAEEAPRKGQKIAQELELPQQQEWAPAEHVKSAPLRAPKAVGSPKQLQRSANFQSATAHRVVPAVVPVLRQVAPATVLRAQRPTVVRGPVPVVPVRPTYVARERYLPASPVLVQPAYRRPVGPRVSFYGSEDEHVGFLKA